VDARESAQNQKGMKRSLFLAKCLAHSVKVKGKDITGVRPDQLAHCGN
jgi:hypothetical protein